MWTGPKTWIELPYNLFLKKSINILINDSDDVEGFGPVNHSKIIQRPGPVQDHEPFRLLPGWLVRFTVRHEQTRRALEMRITAERLGDWFCNKFVGKSSRRCDPREIPGMFWNISSVHKFVICYVYSLVCNGIHLPSQTNVRLDFCDKIRVWKTHHLSGPTLRNTSSSMKVNFAGPLITPRQKITCDAGYLCLDLSSWQSCKT